MQLGAQLYTLRHACRTLPGFADALTRVADMGYRTVQVSGTCAFEADWLREQLRRTGLKCVLTHTPPARLLDDTAQVVKDHTLFGCGCIGLGYWAFDARRGMSYEKFLSLWPAVGRRIRAGGKYFLFHNHDREFIRRSGRPILAHLAEAVPPEDMGFTLDTYWVQRGGADPAQWLERLSGRIPCIHLKDCAWDGAMVPVGEGNINFDRVFEKAQSGGTRYMLVEQDDCNGEDPFACLRRSYDYLRACGFE